MAEVPICFRDREAGQSKMSLPIAFEALMLVPRMRREAREWRTDSAPGGGRRIRWRFQRRPGPRDAGFDEPPREGEGDGRNGASAQQPKHPDVTPRSP